MDFLTDLLPLLIIGALYLLGNIGKLMKKKPEQPTRKPMPQPAEVREAAVPITKKKTAKKVQKKAPEPLLTYDLEHKDERLTGNGPILVEEEEDAPITIASDLKDAEEMRKAIVYAEIFNRKF